MNSHRPIDKGTALLWSLIALATIAIWAGIIWATGLHDWLVANVTKDMLGYAAATVFFLVMLLVITFKEPPRT